MKDSSTVHHESPRNAHVLFGALTVFLVSMVLYSRAVSNGFVNWDDSFYIYGNPNLTGLGIELVRWAFTSFYYGHWSPLLWLSFALDHTLWGLSPAGYHFTSAVLHGLNSALVTMLSAVLFARSEAIGKGNAVYAGTAVGLLFAVHPLHVEAVAWASSRKDVLYSLFYLAGLYAYTRSVMKTPGRRLISHRMSLLLFACALMSKPMAITLPAVLLLLDFYYFERFRNRGEFVRVAVVEKIPFYVLGAVYMLIAAAAAMSADILSTDIGLHTVRERLWMSIRAIGEYAYKTVLPLDLAPYYPIQHRVEPLSPEYAGALLLIVLLTGTGIFLWLRKRAPGLLTAWLFVLVTLLPTLGIVSYGITFMADRFMYLALLGFLMPFGWAVGNLLWRSTTSVRSGALASVAILVTVWGILSANQIGYWRDSVELWKHSSELHPNDYVPYNKLGEVYREKRDYSAAIEWFSRAIAVDPFQPDVYFKRSRVYLKTGNHRMALKDVKMSIEIETAYLSSSIRRHADIEQKLAERYRFMGSLYEQAGRSGMAESSYGKARALEEGVP
jgi:hypothetical protein